jgi:VWFA-related protein
MRATIVRAVLLGMVVAALAVPPGALRALARSQSQEKQPQQQQPPPPPADQQQKKPTYTLSVEVPVVNLDVVVTDNNGDFISGLKKQNFRVLDDGVQQTVTNFAPTDAPITIVMLMEFSRLGYQVFAYTARQWGYGFLNQLGPKDWVALITFDLKSHIEVDFTQNKGAVQEAIASLYSPGFTEANLFDSLLDTLDRLQDVKGKKSILIIASGFDTFSHHTLDQTLKQLQQTDVTIFCVGVGEQMIDYLDERGLIGGTQRVGYYQAKNELSTFARMTGGRAWFPRFTGELPGIFGDVAASLRNQYSLAYTPSNHPNDGKYHKIKLELLGDDGSPLVITNQKGKKVKYVVYAREGYLAPKTGVGD